MAPEDNGIPAVAEVVVDRLGIGRSGGRAPARRRRRERRRRWRPASRMRTRRSTSRRGSSSCGTASRTGATAPCRRPPAPGRELHWPRGKVLGGSSALNGMIYARGHRSDYDTWAYLGNDGWSYDDVLPVFKRSEDFDRGESEYHGAGGPLHVLSRYEPHPVNAAVVAAARRRRASLQRRLQRRACSTASRSASSRSRTAVRQTGATAFLAPVAGAADLTVLTGAMRAAPAVRGRALRRRRDRARGRRRADPRRARGRRLRRHDRVAQAPAALRHRRRRRARPPRNRRRRRPARRRAQPARPRALAGHLRRLAAGAAGAPGPPAAAQPSLLAQPARPARARRPAALLPPAALPRGHGRAGRRLHADGRDHPAGEPRRAATRLGRSGRAAAASTRPA